MGDSRAVLGTRDQRNRLTAVQLTVDLKPDLPGKFSSYVSLHSFTLSFSVVLAYHLVRLSYVNDELVMEEKEASNVLIFLRENS